MVLNSLRAYNVKNRKKYGQMVIACDSRGSWRRELFPYYKARRKIARQKSDLDWDTINLSMDNIKLDLAKFFPYRVIEIDGCEADDVIGTLCHKFGSKPICDDMDFGYGMPGSSDEDILIVSGDKDFKQLCIYDNVAILDPITKIVKTVNDPNGFLFELILRGDASDDIPNVLSPGDSFVTGTRQKQLRQTKIDELKDTDKVNWPVEILENFHRNEVLIDLTKVPTEMQTKILAKYDEQGGKGRSHLFNYMAKNGLGELMENLQDF